MLHPVHLRVVDILMSNLSGLRRDATNCALVSKAWNISASRVLYKRVEVRTIRKLSNCLAIQRNNNGTFCKELIFIAGYEFSDERPSEEYEELFTFLPNIQKIILQWVSVRNHHLQQIKKHANLIKHVKEVTPEVHYWFTFEMENFKNCISAFKDTMQHISLSAFGTTLLSGTPQLLTNDQFKNVLSFLSYFTSLTSLNITNKQEDVRVAPLYMFFTMQARPNLVRFCLDNDFKEPELDYTDYNFDHSKLEFMEIQVPDVNKSHIKYMVKNITGLKHIPIKMGYRSGSSDPPEPVQWLENIGSRFSKYLSNIQTVALYMGENISRNGAENWPFGNGVISNNKSIPAHISLTLVNLDNGLFKRETVLEKYQDRVFLDCVADMKELSTANDNSIQPIFHKII